MQLQCALFFQSFPDYLPWSGFKKYLATTLSYFLVALTVLSGPVAQLLHKGWHGIKATEGERSSLSNPYPQRMAAPDAFSSNFIDQNLPAAVVPWCWSQNHCKSVWQGCICSCRLHGNDISSSSSSFIRAPREERLPLFPGCYKPSKTKILVRSPFWLQFKDVKWKTFVQRSVPTSGVEVVWTYYCCFCFKEKCNRFF